MSNQNIDLVSVFQQVTQALGQNQQALNQSDTYNHDHGDHMVKTFQTITKAMKKKKTGSQAELLAYAAENLNKGVQNGSSQLYAKGLSQAAQQAQGKNIDPQMAMQLLQTILGGGQKPTQAVQPTQQTGSGDMLGSLLGGLMGGGQQPSNQEQSGSGDMLGSLLGGLMGGQPNQSTGQAQAGGLSDGLDMGDLITAGMAYFQSKQRGEDNLNAIIDAFTAASGMGNDPHRQQSTQIVANTFLQALGKMGKK
ncbi:MAG: hypothetical protein CVU39_23925 [Chloroflexi bacterium HGW-Chloroflexi-10]|nr:MAG: hypothetical protein CVU39_23925 [Chloroflexi bacterium HGW-Chloroflexi-10]